MNYMSDLFVMHTMNDETHRNAIGKYAEEAVKSNEKEFDQIRALEESLRTLFDALVIKKSKNCLHNDLIDAAKGEIEFFRIADHLIFQYKEGGI